MELIDLHLLIRGRVQGVGFRDSLVGQARRAGVAGWVRNRGYDAVEAVLRGPPQAVESVAAWAAVGPRSARVERVDRRPPTPAERSEIDAGFARLPSV